MPRADRSTDDDGAPRLRLSMRPLTNTQPARRDGGAWSVFGWVMVGVVGAVVLLAVLGLLLFINEPGPPPGP